MHCLQSFSFHWFFQVSRARNEYNTREYNGVTLEVEEHNTIYTDYVKVEVYYATAVGGELLSAKTLSLLATYLIVLSIAVVGIFGLSKTKKIDT